MVVRRAVRKNDFNHAQRILLPDGGQASEKGTALSALIAVASKKRLPDTGVERLYIVELRPAIRAGAMAVQRILAVGADRFDFDISTRRDAL